MPTADGVKVGVTGGEPWIWMLLDAADAGLCMFPRGVRSLGMAACGATSSIPQTGGGEEVYSQGGEGWQN